jgi:hypothetical protein
MPATPPGGHPGVVMRFSALAAPAFLFVYGVLRLIDGLDGDHGPGLAWNLGHTAFLIAFLLFGVLAVFLRNKVPTALAWVATVAALLGVAAFVWVILGDLFESVPELPDPLFALGPIVFELGVLTLLVLHAVRRLVPGWSPVVVFLGFIPIAVNLDLLPLGALVILGGLWPVFAESDRGMKTAAPALSGGNST